jgi:hypothetical protein
MEFEKYTIPFFERIKNKEKWVSGSIPNFQ